MKQIDREHRKRVRLSSLIIAIQSKNGVSFDELSLLNGYFRCANYVARNPIYKRQFDECTRILESVVASKREKYTLYGRYYNKLVSGTYAMCDLFDVISDSEFRLAATNLHVN